MTEVELLALHRRLVSIPSPSKSEEAVLLFVAEFLSDRGVVVERIGRNLVARHGPGPYMVFNSHLDTVPASPRWTRDPYVVETIDGRVYGLGSNDAKASVAAMIAAFLRLRARHDLSLSVLLMLVCDEETGGQGTETLLPDLLSRGHGILAAVIGEPTGLNIAIAQKGMMVLELLGEGTGCHAAHAKALDAKNAIREVARDILRLAALELPEDSLLGPVTIEPTLIRGGIAKNMVPTEAVATLDVRTNPSPTHDTLTATLRNQVRSTIRVVSSRLLAVETDVSEAIVRAAQSARPLAKLFGSRGLSDWVFFAGIPAVKVGPGATERSHTADEFVFEHEVIEGAAFYEKLAINYAVHRKEEKAHDATLGSR